MAAKRTLIFIPTYNEAKNVEVIFRQINDLKLNTDVQFLDDNSPDGTGDIIDKLAEHYPNVHAIHRSGKLGVGSAHLDGIHWAYKNRYKILITMDCDFSHSPRYLLDFINHSSDSDVIIGSRYMEQDSYSGWSWFRRLINSAGHCLTTTALKMPYDATGAFRLYNLEKIPVEVFDLVFSKGYSFMFESLYILQLNGFTIKEIPIKVSDRIHGESKLSFRDLLQSLIHFIQIYLKTLTNKKSLFYSGYFKVNQDDN